MATLLLNAVKPFKLAAAYVAGNSTGFVLEAGAGAWLDAQIAVQGAGAVSADNDLHFFVLPSSNVVGGVPVGSSGAVAYIATGKTGDTLTPVAPTYSGTNASFAAGDSVFFGLSAKTVGDLQAAALTAAATAATAAAGVDAATTAAAAATAAATTATDGLALKAPIAAPTFTDTATFAGTNATADKMVLKDHTGSTVATFDKHGCLNGNPFVANINNHWARLTPPATDANGPVSYNHGLKSASNDGLPGAPSGSIDQVYSQGWNDNVGGMLVTGYPTFRDAWEYRWWNQNINGWQFERHVGAITDPATGFEFRPYSASTPWSDMTQTDQGMFGRSFTVGDQKNRVYCTFLASGAASNAAASLVFNHPDNGYTVFSASATDATHNQIQFGGANTTTEVVFMDAAGNFSVSIAPDANTIFLAGVGGAGVLAWNGTWGSGGSSSSNWSWGRGGSDPNMYFRHDTTGRAFFTFYPGTDAASAWTLVNSRVTVGTNAVGPLGQLHVVGQTVDAPALMIDAPATPSGDTILLRNAAGHPVFGVSQAGGVNLYDGTSGGATVWGVSADGHSVTLPSYFGIGLGATAGTDGFALGHSATAGSAGLAIGFQAVAASSALAAGYIASASGGYSTCLGYNSNDGGFALSTCLGYNTLATASNQVVIGTAAETVVIAGKIALGGPIGVNGATPPAKAASPGTATGPDAAVINAQTAILRNAGFCS